MVDTIIMQLHNPEVRIENRLTLSNHIFYEKKSRGNQKYLFLLDDGSKIFADKAYYNDPSFNLTIQRAKYNTHENSFFYIQLSFSKLLQKNKKIRDYKNELVRVLRSTNKRLSDIGIVTDLYMAKLCRIDFYTDLETNYCFDSYKKIFDGINLIYRKTISDYPTTTIYKSKKKEIIIYDKNIERQSRTDKKLEFTKNCIRLETKFISQKCISSNFKINCVEQLISKYERINKLALTLAGDMVFIRKIKAESVLFPKLRAMLTNYSQRCNKQWWHRFQKDIAYEVLLRQFTPNEFKQIMLGVSKDRTKIHRITKELSEYNLNRIMNQNCNSQISYYDLYKEFKEKFYSSFS